MLPEVLHCIQQGLHEYFINGLFGQKKVIKRGKKSRQTLRKCKRLETDIDKSSSKSKRDVAQDTQSDDDCYIAANKNDLSRKGVFGPKYRSHIEQLCKKYGNLLQHQSDKSLPRTKFSSAYTNTTKKSGHEMRGLLLVYLVVFQSSEGFKIDKQLDKNRTSAYIHCMELLLMLEHFCQSRGFSRDEMKVFAEGVPLLLNTYKNTLNREEGCGMKIIKFHLVLHFAANINRFGSMENMSSAIGERFHVTEIKAPAQNTQRRKDCFEQQTAQRYFENISIMIAAKDSIVTRSNSNVPTSNDPIPNGLEYKNQNIKFDCVQNQLLKKDSTNKKSIVCKWNDTTFQMQLIELCQDLYKTNKIKSHEISFFTQHNRNGNIFRADPDYRSEPWYDWACIDYGNDDKPVPAKLLIFVDLRENFVEEFKIGQTWVTEPGCYALGYTMNHAPNEPGHNISLLVEYGELALSSNQETEHPELNVFHVDSIAD